MNTNSTDGHVTDSTVLGHLRHYGSTMTVSDTILRSAVDETGGQLTVADTVTTYDSADNHPAPPLPNLSNIWHP